MTKDCKKYKTLIMGLIDDELTPAEASDVNNHLIKCSSCRNEYEMLKKSSDSLEGLTYMEPRDVDLDRIWKSPYSKFAKNFGLIMVIAGWLAIILFSLLEILRSSSEPVIPKISMAAIIIGFVILLLVALRDRITTYKSDPYKEVER